MERTKGPLSVTQLNDYLKMLLDGDRVLSDVWVRGEISNFTVPRSGHLYLTLKDEEGQVRSVMFRTYAMRLPFTPNDGMKVLAQDWEGTVVPSQAYAEGGIHEAIAFYEDNVFYEILAEELSRRDMDYPEINDDNYAEIISRMDKYMSEFEASGVDRLVLEE